MPPDNVVVMVLVTPGRGGGGGARETMRKMLGVAPATDVDVSQGRAAEF